MPAYQHTQVSPLRLHFIGLLLILVAAVLEPFVVSIIVAVVGIVLGLVGLVFGRLTVTVGGGTLKLAFGGGVLHKSFDVAQVVESEIIRTKWWYGWGIRLTPFGWMWNVAGLDAVLLKLDNQKSFVVGTDEPQRLHTAVADARARAADG